MKNLAQQTPAPENTRKSTGWKIAIIVLAVLVIFSAGALAVRYIYLGHFASSQGTTTVPNNLIGEVEDLDQDAYGVVGTNQQPSTQTAQTSTDTTSVSRNSGSTAGGRTSSGAAGSNAEAAVLELYQGRPGDNVKFEVGNMLPGDSVTKYFCVKVNHDADITLLFNAEVTGQSQNLGDVLHIKVTHLDTGTVLCDAPFSQVDRQEFSELLKQNAQNETIAYYQIDVSVDTSAGNEYQGAALTADFNWYVNENEEGTLTPPKTGDTTNIVLWAVLAVSAAGVLILLLKSRKGEKDYDHA